MKNQSLGRIEDKHCLGVVIGLNKEILIAFNLRTGIICCYMSIYSFRTLFLFIHLYVYSSIFILGYTIIIAYKNYSSFYKVKEMNY
jgi:hypothetical protein